MSQFRCPLCGKYNSYARYDPGSFDDDIYGADVTGLGRGRGFHFSEKYSLLDDDHLRRFITQRCRRILWFTEGEEPPPIGSMTKLQKINQEWSAWGAGAENTITQQANEINRLRSMNSSLLKTVNSVRGESSAQSAQIEDYERTIHQWQVAYNNVKSGSDAKDKAIRDLKATVQRLRDKVDAYEEASLDDEDSAAAAEMETLLQRINDSSNTNYGTLSDAIDWLLED